MPAIDDQRVQPALDAILRGDAQALEAAIDSDPEVVGLTWGENTLLEWVTQPPHGVSEAVVEVLIGRGSPLDRALNLAGCWNLAPLCTTLLAAGADASARADAGITPLESAAMHGSTAAADVLRRHGLHRPSLWLAAAAGLTDELQSWVSADGALLRPAGPYRPNWADVGRPPGDVPVNEATEIIGEAFTFAAANGRLDTADRLLEAGADIDARPYRNTTALHLAIHFRQPDAVHFLIRRGASLDIEDDNHHSTARGWAHACLVDDDPRTQRIVELTEAAA